MNNSEEDMKMKIDNIHSHLVHPNWTHFRQKYAKSDPYYQNEAKEEEKEEYYLSEELPQNKSSN